MQFLYCSNTNSKVQGEAEDIWKFQKYSLIVDFEEKLIFPPPLNVFSYMIMIIQKVCCFVRYCYRRCRRDCSQCCRKKHDFTVSFIQKITMNLSFHVQDVSCNLLIENKKPTRICIIYSSRNNSFNLLVRIKFLNLFLYCSK